jgi:hypothetical protein
MGRNADALSEKQITTLAWIRDGCPAVDGETEVSRKISAASLRSRGLATVKGQGATWRASITAKGRAWLEAHPATVAADIGGPDGLIARVLAADGRLAIGGDAKDKAAHDELVRLSHHAATRPRGWRLEAKNAGSWSAPAYEVVLVRHFEDLVDELPVPVPERVARYHPAVRAYLDDRDRLAVSREHVSRAGRILQAIADEAPRRGLEVVAPRKSGLPPTVDAHGRREPGRSCLTLQALAGTYDIRIQEVSGPSKTPVPQRAWGQRSTRAAWLDGRQFEFVSTGILELIVEGPGLGYSGGYRIRDSATMTLDERLLRVFRRIELHRLEAEHEAQERERAAAERQRRWEAAMTAARTRYDEQARWEAFEAASRSWDEVARHRAFLAAAREAAGALGGRLRGELLAHLDFAERRIDAADPLANPDLLLPRVREPKPDDLKPYLGGLSPHGPEEGRW